MNPFLIFDLRRTGRKPFSYVTAVVLLSIGVFTGSKFNLSVGEGIFLNSPYTIGYMTGMLSLAIIFVATVIANQLLFKEFDSGAAVIFFSLPVSKSTFLKGRFLSFFLLTFSSFLVLMLGFTLGQYLRPGTGLREGFHLWHYLFPVLVFGICNSLLVCSVLFLLAFSTRKKLLVIIGGLLLYVLYMVVLVFSGSPFMAGAIPQSLEAQQVSAVTDPFGLSSYFLDSKDFTPSQRNAQVVPFSGYLLLNRLFFTALSLLLLLFTFYRFSFAAVTKKRKPGKDLEMVMIAAIPGSKDRIVAKTFFGFSSLLKSVFSFARKDSIYLFKSISMAAVSLLLLFYVGMELYAEIEKGIRIPQKYASSGLMATAIIENFHLFGLLLLVYFVNDVFWRSHTSGFSLIENSTCFSASRVKGHFISISVLLVYFSVLLIVEGWVFQWCYDYFHIEWQAYLGVFLFATFPLVLFAGLLLWLNKVCRNRFLALGISLLAILPAFAPVSQKIFPNPLLRVFSGFKGAYSDFNGYGLYAAAFAQRLIFGACTLLLLWVFTSWVQRKKIKLRSILFASGLLVTGFFSGKAFLKGYIPRQQQETLEFAATYEKQYKKYANLPQPVITEVKTDIRLFPSANAYTIEGTYTLENLTDQEVRAVLFNFHPELKMESAELKMGGKSWNLDKYISEVSLHESSLKPNEKATLHFVISYRWFAANGHQSFNAIIENGSFIRISRYFPAIGYQQAYELSGEAERKKFQLGKPAALKKADDAAVYEKDFIKLDMTVSTEALQTAIGTGDLMRQWEQDGRNYFQYKADAIPFRFAVASAAYGKKQVMHRGVLIAVFYEPEHQENVDHLIRNVQLTLDYCTQHFGPYPFKSISFVEVSSFTKGVAATAYPSSIFMTEDMVFHANIKADKKQDVINELAGHELSHLWWGNSGISPDDREGATMLTETLAMYTEMMLYKKMHGKAAMMERVDMHRQIYESEKGFSENLPLYRVTSDATHISYSKGAVAMVELSELIGEEKVNLALRNFLNNNAYPKKPASTDLLNELYRVSPEKEVAIDQLFKGKW